MDLVVLDDARFVVVVEAELHARHCKLSAMLRPVSD